MANVRDREGPREPPPDFLALQGCLGNGQTVRMQTDLLRGEEVILTCTNCGGGDRFAASEIFEGGRLTFPGQETVAQWRAKHRNCERRLHTKVRPAVQQKLDFGWEGP